MRHSEVHRLLLDVGFRNVLWPSEVGQHWGVVGEVDGGERVVVTCVPTPTRGVRLHVSPPERVSWLRELLAAFGVGWVSITGAPLPPERSRSLGSRVPWVELTIGLVSFAVFGWVLWR
jgi:hypothetical protein